MINAMEQAYLNCVIYEYNARVNGYRFGNALVASAISADEVRSLVPRFAEVVADLIARNWIEIREPYSGVWDDATALTETEIAETLADPRCWISDPEGDHRMVMLMPTYQWRQLLTA
jgi:hypothetical protein